MGAEIAVAIATCLLAAVTTWLAWSTKALVNETRQARVDERAERERALLRGALVEQMEICRQLFTHQYNRGGKIAIQPLAGWSPSFALVTQLLGGLDVPGDLAAYLLWLMAQVRIENDRLQEKITLILDTPDQAALPQELATFSIPWSVVLERAQTVACLFQCEATRRGFTDMAAAFRPDAPWLPWLKPLPWPKETPRGNTAQHDELFRSAPPWPQDEAYAPCSPQARDQYANLLAAQQHASLLSA